ncbi:MAG: hypothetical protein K2X50_04945 [Gammaproteobacteria bacterium]|nr:hypothetical protein [Gammaproteobacteria bacterium]
MQKILQDLKDPISGLIFYDPVSTRTKTKTGKTYEREQIEEWIRRRKESNLPITDPLTSEEISDELISNDLVRSMARAYVEEHPEVYDEDKVYLPQAIKNELATAIREGNTQQIKDTLQKDPRLTTTSLNKEGLTVLLAASEQASVEVFRLVLGKLPADESEKRKAEILKEGSLILTQKVAQTMGVEGLDAWCQYLKFDAQFFYHSLAHQAIVRHIPTLLNTLFPRITVNLQETKTGFTFLHTAVKACAERLGKAAEKIPDDELTIIISLFENGADGKIPSNDGETPPKLAERLCNSLLSTRIEKERRRVKFAFLIEPLQDQIRDLTSKCLQLELAKAQLLLALQKHEQAIVVAQRTQSEQLAISQGLLQLEQQKQLKAFVPSVIKSITCGKKIKVMMPVGADFIVCGVTEEDHGSVSRLFVIDLTKSSDQSILSSIKLSERTNSNRFTMLAVDEKRFIFCFESTEQRGNNKEPVKLVLWNIVNKAEEKNYPLAYTNVNIVQVINANSVLISGKREYKDECALLDIKTGKITQHKHLELVDFNEWHSEMPRPTCFRSSVELAYVHYEKDRNHRGGTPKEIRLYNALSNTNLCLTNEEVETFQSSSSKVIFKFISPKLIVVSARSQYSRQNTPTIKIFDIEKKQYIQTYNTPPFKQKGFNTPVSEGFSDACLTPDGLFIAVYHDPEQTHSEGSRLIIWELATGQTKYNIPLQGNIKHLHFDERRNVLYASNGNSIQVYQIYPENVLQKTRATKQDVDTPTTGSGKTFNL